MLGALSLLVTSRVESAIGRDGGPSGEAASALVLLGAEAMTVKALAAATGLTHSGGVRLADRMARSGLVARAEGADRRTVLLTLTPRGDSLRETVLAARSVALEPLLGALGEEDRAALRRLLSMLLARAVESPAEAISTCRLCEEASCVPKGCPVEDRYEALSAT